jgi:GNAT superfamily N-acetyltransferase
MTVRQAIRGRAVGQVARLFKDYAQWIGIDLSFQNFAEELRNLPGEYRPPSGALWLCKVGARPAGCVAVRRLNREDCEMKRLFVRDDFRGLGCGDRLARRAIHWAGGVGYRRMLLDTLPSMGAAHKLYARLGFRQTQPYRFNPVEGTRYLALNLGRRTPPPRIARARPTID